MALFIGIHKRVRKPAHDGDAGMHQAIPSMQHQHEVRFLNYWTNSKTGAVICLVEAPDREAAIRAHRAAHGSVEDEITEVQEDS